MSEPLTLYYAHDPMCSFCWAFRPVWEEVQTELAQSHPEMQIRYLMGGLAPDSDQPMSEETKNKVRAAWQYIETNIPGTRFNHDFWARQTPRRSTYPSCRAVMAINAMAAELEDKMILAIQQAYYLNALNPSDDDTLIGCAVSIGLNEAEFEQQYHSKACEQAFGKQQDFSRSIGINSFPSFVMARGHSRFNVPIEYNDAEKQLDSLRQIATLL